MSKPNEPELQALRATLAARSQVLKIETAEFDAARSEALESARDTVEDAGDAAEGRRHDEVRDGEEQRDLNELHAVESALARIDAGSYGECTDCGIDIPLARLRVQPSAGRCIDCQKRAEGATTGAGAVAG